MLRRYVEQILSIYNYLDGIMVTDKYGYVEYYVTFRPDVNNLKEKDILRKHITEVYPTLNEETSSILRVLKTGKPISNEFQTLITYKGQSIRAINTTMPIKDHDEIIGAVDVSRYIDSPYQRQDISLSLKESVEKKNLYAVDDIVTNSRSMELIKERIPMIADTDSSVLIYGETGTGKELVAQSIHTASKRRNKKFVSQNCAAIPGNLLESILFGTTKGSYTGAENKPGLFEIASGGTLFLDEINSMEISVQPKILKAIEEKQVVRLGGYEPIKTDIKIVSAVNENPLQCIAENKLREDLFYRLSVVQLNIPPLRERINDLFYLVSHFINIYNTSMHCNLIGIDEEVETIFRGYNWPGNVRELKNVIEGAFNVASARFIQKKDLPEYLTRPFVLEEIGQNALMTVPAIPLKGISLEEALETYERELIEHAVAISKNYVEAAKLLGITKQALNYKLRKYRLRE
ncbi:MAG: sigma-54 interaction domain-containing protein [Emergencia timonensis]|uniref:sigma-54 interaction domain-containing protein n=1 Tax=Emergencia timonensis TaxID=1776384 RepID=UPI00082D6D35|nr:sigma 54-interacting transcriptional regulator [Emergencia timonensis]WNX87985.1 sigma 54-interacting transcriptional regulator [Emergencia timonensis]